MVICYRCPRCGVISYKFEISGRHFKAFCSNCNDVFYGDVR